MFVLNPGGSGPNGKSGSSSGDWPAWKGRCYFFGRLAAYFAALRLAHVLWGDPSPGPPAAIEN